MDHTDNTPAATQTHEVKTSQKRLIVKSVTYRVFIVILDFFFIYLMTHKIEVAVGFMLVSNIYTTIGYYFHERIWSKINWGRTTVVK